MSFFFYVDWITLLSCLGDEEGIIRMKARVTEKIDTPYFLSTLHLHAGYFYS